MEVSPPGKALQRFLDFANEHNTDVAVLSYIRDERRTNIMPLFLSIRKEKL